MLLARKDPVTPAKGWYRELLHCELPLIGFANQGVNEPHYHGELYEVYLVARGSSTIEVEGASLTLHAGDVLAIEPGETHTFTASTPDYFHFVLHCPPVAGDKVLAT